MDEDEVEEAIKLCEELIEQIGENIDTCVEKIDDYFDRWPR